MVMTTLIFIIVSRLHAFFLVVPVRSSLHVLVVVAVILYFQQREPLEPPKLQEAKTVNLCSYGPGISS